MEHRARADGGRAGALRGGLRLLRPHRYPMHDRPAGHVPTDHLLVPRSRGPWRGSGAPVFPLFPPPAPPPPAATHSRPRSKLTPAACMPRTACGCSGTCLARVPHRCLARHDFGLHVCGLQGSFRVPTWPLASALRSSGGTRRRRRTEGPPAWAQAVPWVPTRGVVRGCDGFAVRLSVCESKHGWLVAWDLLSVCWFPLPRCDFSLSLQCNHRHGLGCRSTRW